MKQITINQTGYVIEGIADLSLWGGGNACIKMRRITLPELPTDLQELKPLLNDSGFGVESINGAVISIFEKYEHGVNILINDDIIIGKVSEDTHECYYEGDY